MSTSNVLRLTGPWKLALDPANVGRGERWWNAMRPDAQEAPVPGIIQQVFPGYHGVAWYWLAFRADILLDGRQQARLHFGAVDYAAEVWLNGQVLGGHEGGEGPFELDATPALRPGAENLLAVRVLNPGNEPVDGCVLNETPHRNKVVPYRIGSSFNQGGIVAPVELRRVPLVRISDAFARPEARTGRVRVRVALHNALHQPVAAQLHGAIGPATAQGSAESTWDGALVVPPGASVQEIELQVAQPHLWNLEDPYLYRVALRLEAAPPSAPPIVHEHSLRCGLRDFRVDKGFFRLNGRRVFVRSTHTGNHYPIGQQVPVDPDFLRRDLINAKAAGFNMVRFIAGVAYPEQLDFCDELGLMVYEECYAAWCLADGPQMGARFDQATSEMVLRDRNHPSVTVWGLLNETVDGPVFRQAVAFLPKLRALDDTRLVLLGSGRWDCQWSIGSVSNPGSAAWEHVWGAEAPDAPPAPYSWTLGYPGGYFQQAGDAHVYPSTPQTPETDHFMRTLGYGTKPVFLSEYGIGSLFNVVREMRRFEQAGARADLEDAALMRDMADRLAVDWKRWGMQDTYSFLDDMLRDSQRLHARQRLLGFDLIRANPQIAGYNLTGMLDHGMTGEGLWTFWREWKPGIVDTLADGWAPLRWCTFVSPLHGYVGRPITVEAVLANEDVLAPGDYPVCLRIAAVGRGVVWEKRLTVRVPRQARGEDGPLALPVAYEEVTLKAPPGRYEFAAYMERGGAPAGGRLRFQLSDPTDLPRGEAEVAVWGIAPHVQSWLEAQRIACVPFTGEATAHTILVGEPGAGEQTESLWGALFAQVARGATAVLLAPQAWRRGDDSLGWLPLAGKGRCYAFHDWLYHKECVAKPHPVFEGLPPAGIMDWDLYGAVISHEMLDMEVTPDEVMAAAFAVSYPCPGAYASGILLGAFAHGAGHYLVNTLRLLDNVDQHPAADRLLLNLIGYAAGLLSRR